ncbi:MAG: hypothetical protein M1544_03360 [Candidatus Marsarchaeota archaeon]|nr:hypothetical protein [Candidatus Marsarchaeota archaeon]
MQGLELVVFVSTLIIALLSGVLAAFMTAKWYKNRGHSFLFWATGLWVFTIAVLFESAFSLNFYSEALIDIYLFLVVFLVESLAMGSLHLLKHKGIKCVYIIYIILIDILLVIAFSTSNVSNVIVNHVVYGILPLFVVVASSLGTFPAAAILIIVAAISYRNTKNAKMLSIIAGTIVVSIAGTLYIAAIPEFLYYSEFIGILLLWFGFFSFRPNKHETLQKHSGATRKQARKSRTKNRSSRKKAASKRKRSRNR